MSIACPSCKAVLNPKGLKPGKFTPKCPKCTKPFLILVPDDPSGTISVQQLADAAPRPAEAATRVGAADTNATGDFTEPEPSQTPVPRPVKRTDPDTTGDFTEADTHRSHVGAATGDFTEGNDNGAAHDHANHTDRMADGDVSEDAPTRPGPNLEKRGKLSDADIPQRLGGYEVLKVLGKGGMGAVLLGRQVSLDRKVALKVMHPRIAKNPGFVARFTREAYAAAQLTHHNVVQIYDIGEDAGQHYFSMEFVPGQSLMDVVKKDGKVAPEVAVGYVLQAARGLRYGHNQGMVHRDIKPDNLMLNTEGIVKVADLGLVKLPSGELPAQAGAIPADHDDGPGNSNLTRAGAVMGTPAYMPPEQARDSAHVDQRADIYSLGCSLYVLLTGRPPFEGKTALEIITKHLKEPIVPPEAVVKEVPKSLSAILMKMLAKKPDERYQNMDEVIAALNGFLSPDRAGPFAPSQEQANRIEMYADQYNDRSRGGLKVVLALAFFAACLIGVVATAVAGRAILAAGVFGLMVMTPVAYFVVHGVLSGGVVFARFRAAVFGMRFLDWVMWVGGGLLVLATLFLFGVLWAWLGFAVLAVGLAFVLWAFADRSQDQAREEPLDDARILFKTMRVAGCEEDALRQFVCKYSGTNWEPFYEGLFGYEAKLAARAYRKQSVSEESKAAGAWREPVVDWIDATLEARKRRKEQELLHNVEAKALEAEGVDRAEADARAGALAEDLVSQAAGFKQARRAGQPVSVREMVEAARVSRRPRPGYNIAGVPLRDLWLKHFINDWFGRRLRFCLGLAVLGVGLLWMHQNNLLKGEQVVAAVESVDLDAVKKAAEKTAADAGKAKTKPLKVSFLPEAVTKPINSFAIPGTGLLLMLSGMFHFGWRPAIVAIPGAVIGVFGASAGVPAIGPLSGGMVSLAVAAVLILGVGRFLRQ